MKIVLAGDWHSNVHERPMAEALERLGHSVEPFAWHTYVGRSVTRRAQNKYLVGPMIRQINRDLVDCVARVRPELLFIYRGTHITRTTLEKIRVVSPHTLLVGYNNDDPFAPRQPRWPWRHFIDTIAAYDRVLAYRPHNVTEFLNAGARSTGLLLPWFVPRLHRPLTLTEEERRLYSTDVVFVGHYEQDDRLASLEALTAAGIAVKVFGPGRGLRGHDWDGPLGRSAQLRHLVPVNESWGDDYCKALCGASIALCFLSKRNRDAYTRRCFEIPATRTLLLSEHSPELAEMFREGIEAEFFRSRDELVDKVRFYIRHPASRAAVAAKGYERVFADGHDVDTRVRRLLASLTEPDRIERAG